MATPVRLVLLEPRGQHRMVSGLVPQEGHCQVALGSAEGCLVAAVSRNPIRAYVAEQPRSLSLIPATAEPTSHLPYLPVGGPWSLMVTEPCSLMWLPREQVRDQMIPPTASGLLSREKEETWMGLHVGPGLRRERQTGLSRGIGTGLLCRRVRMAFQKDSLRQAGHRTSQFLRIPEHSCTHSKLLSWLLPPQK